MAFAMPSAWWGSKSKPAAPTCRGSEVTFEQATGVPSRNASQTGKLAASKSVGTVMMADTIRSAIEEGAEQFDMLLGNEPYKLRFANDRYTVQTIVVTRAMHPHRLLASGEAWARRNGARLRGRPGFERVNRVLRRLLPTADRF